MLDDFLVRHINKESDCSIFIYEMRIGYAPYSQGIRVNFASPLLKNMSDPFTNGKFCWFFLTNALLRGRSYFDKSYHI